MHIVIIDKDNGKVVSSRVFDTYKSSADFEKFILNDVPVDSIVIAACKDDCSKNLSEKSKQWFA